MSTNRLKRSTPEEQGMNGEKLCKLIEYVKGSSKVQSMLILRNGFLVADIHFHPFHREVSYYLNCCTASVTSALVGIALGEGLIGSIHDKVAGYFPEYESLFDDPRKKEISIEHLLMMTVGLVWDDVRVVFGEDCYDERMRNSEDPLRFILEQPMGEEPGIRYNHCIGAPHLLSAILQRVTGMSTAAYAEEKLFSPLGIEGTEWFSDKNGVTIGESGLAMTMESLAKIGQLFLQKGKWEGVQLIPESWVELSTRKHVETPEGPWSFYGGGYQWNMNRFGGYCAKGVNGQYFAVIPGLKLVVVLMAALSLDEFFWPETLIETFIIPSCRGAVEKRSNSQFRKRMPELEKAIQRPPVPGPVPELPATAAGISGLKYVFAASPGINGVSLDFSDKNCCRMTVWHDQGVTEVPAGLDNIYRISGNEAYKGCWQDEENFSVTMWNLGVNYQMEHRFKFYGDKVSYELYSAFWGVCEKAEGMRETI